MRDFWETYEAHYQQIADDLLQRVEGMPQIAAILRQMPKEEQEKQSAQSRALMKGAVIDGQWDALLANQHQQGAFYAAMGLAFDEWFALVAAFQELILPALVQRHGKDPDRLVAAIVAMNAYTDMAMSAIGEEYLRTKENIISQQAAAIQELSTPVLQPRERMLLVPLVGLLDTQRARMLTEQLLNAIRAHRAKVVVVDITGVAAVDSKVANHLFQTVAAARLMGARTVVTGLSSDVAQALVTLGIDVDRLNTVGDLQGGLEEAERMLGYRLTRIDSTSA